MKVKEKFLHISEKIRGRIEYVKEVSNISKSSIVYYIAVCFIVGGIVFFYNSNAIFDKVRFSFNTTFLKTKHWVFCNY